MLRWISVLLIGAGLSGCGRTGDLYLPPETLSEAEQVESQIESTQMSDRADDAPVVDEPEDESSEDNPDEDNNQ